MKVDVVKNQNYAAGTQRANYPKGRNNTSQPAYAPNFTGNYTERITKSLPHAKSIETMEKLKWLKGEIGGILITALGTGLVAPIFIGFNPFVKAPKNATPEEKKENENTKLYTAMRQPISAVLAILFQASVLKYIDKGLDQVFNNPKYAKYARLLNDQQELNTETYIKSNIQKEMTKEGKTKPSWFTALFSSDAKEKRKAYTEEFNKRVKAKQETQLAEVARKFQTTGKINIGERHLDFPTTAELVNKQIDSYIADARALQKSPETIGKYLDRAELLINNKTAIKDAFGKISENNVTADVQKLLSSSETDPKIKVLLKEILDKPEDLRYSRVRRTLQRINCIKTMCNRNFTRDTYRNALLDRNKVLTDRIVELTAAKVDPKTATQESIKEAIKKIAQQCSFKDVDGGIAKSVLCDTDTFGKSIDKLTAKIYKDVAKGYKKLVENSYKSTNQFTKIGVGVFITLPITCTALNWVYPRFMDLFFPELSGAKEKKQAQKIGGNK